MSLTGPPKSKTRRRGCVRGAGGTICASARRAIAPLIVLSFALAPTKALSQSAAVKQSELLQPSPYGDPYKAQKFHDVDVGEATAVATRFLTDPPPDNTSGSATSETAESGSSGIVRGKARRSKRPPRFWQPPPETEAPPAPELDIFAPTGVKAGKFLLKPAVELTTGYDSNPTRLPGGKGSPVVIVAPELALRSQFDRYQLNADLRATYTEATAVAAARRPTVDAKVNGRYDVTDKTAINGEARYNLEAGVPIALGAVGQITRLPLVDTFGGTVGATHRFDPVEVSLGASVDRVVFQGASLRGGLAVANQDRNMTQFGGQSRVTYAMTSEFRPFVSVGADRRAQDQQADFNGFRRDSTGIAVEVGAAFTLPGKLAGEAAVGYLTRKYADPLLPNVSGFIADASLAFLPTQDTTVLFVAKSQAIESAIPGNSGMLRRDGIIEADQQFGAQTTGSLKAGYGWDSFAGIGRVDNRYFVGAGIVYKFSRLLQFKIDLQQEWLCSNMPINNVTATVVTIGVRAQY
jgi:hypothetical protein